MRHLRPRHRATSDRARWRRHWRVLLRVPRMPKGAPPLVRGSSSGRRPRQEPSGRVEPVERGDVSHGERVVLRHRNGEGGGCTQGNRNHRVAFSVTRPAALCAARTHSGRVQRRSVSRSSGTALILRSDHGSRGGWQVACALVTPHQFAPGDRLRRRWNPARADQPRPDSAGMPRGILKRAEVMGTNGGSHEVRANFATRTRCPDHAR